MGGKCGIDVYVDLPLILELKMSKFIFYEGNKKYYIMLSVWQSDLNHYLSHPRAAQQYCD